MDFPRLSKSPHTFTSPEDHRYNCIAWAASDTRRVWWPDTRNIGYWPPKVPRKTTVRAFELAYRTLGYRKCDSLIMLPFASASERH